MDPRDNFVICKILGLIIDTCALVLVYRYMVLPYSTSPYKGRKSSKMAEV